MLNIFQIVILVVVYTLSFFSSASLITNDLTEDSFYTYAELDWAWVSPVNIQFIGCSNLVLNPDLYLTSVYSDPNNSCDNQLLDPSFHAGWRFATDDELQILKNEISLSNFIRADFSFINATMYWNTSFTHVDYVDFMNGNFSSQWGNSTFETFYVRDAKTVPEPTTLMIFALGLITLAVRKKYKN